MKRLLLGIVALTIVGRLAYAQTPEKVAEEHFVKGNTAYNLGRWDEAVTHFTKAYESWQQPEFLYNIAQSYRQAGNCKQALHFYKRFRSLKENDRASPLSRQKREEVDRFIQRLTECAAKADSTATAKPDTLDKPGDTGTATTPGTGPSPSTTQPMTTPTTVTQPATGPTSTTVPANAKTAQVAPPLDQEEDDEEDLEPAISAQTPPRAKLVSARVESGIALLGAGDDLDIPMQPAFLVSGGYPLAAGPATIEVGAGLSYTPLPYEVMGAQKQGSMLGVRALGVGSYPVAPKLALRGSVGLGIVALAGLEMGNPLTTDRSAQSFTLFNVRLGVAADFAITDNIVATVQPFAIAYSPGADGMYADSLREIDVLVGVGYRQ